jgi:hypothetical protein
VCGWFVAIFHEFLLDILRHEDVNISFLVVPFQDDSTVEFSIPTCLHLVVFLEDIH